MHECWRFKQIESVSRIETTHLKAKIRFARLISELDLFKLKAHICLCKPQIPKYLRRIFLINVSTTAAGPVWINYLLDMYFVLNITDGPVASSQCAANTYKFKNKINRWKERERVKQRKKVQQRCCIQIIEKKRERTIWNIKICVSSVRRLVFLSVILSHS